MNEVDKLINLMHRAFYGEAWHGPSVMEALEGVTGRAARERPLSKAHNIWEITAHLSSWEEYALWKAAGNSDNPPDHKDWPEIGSTMESDWKNLLTRVKRIHEDLEKALRGFSDEELQGIVPGRQDSFYVLLNGILQHNLYHAGQISLLKKAVS